MDRCHDCDGPITGDAELRDVETAPRTTFQQFLAAALIPGLGQAHLRRVRLCAACAAARDAEGLKKNRGGVTVFFVILLGFLLLSILSVVYLSGLAAPGGR